MASHANKHRVRILHSSADDGREWASSRCVCLLLRQRDCELLTNNRFIPCEMRDEFGSQWCCFVYRSISVSFALCAHECFVRMFGRDRTLFSPTESLQQIFTPVVLHQIQRRAEGTPFIFRSSVRCRSMRTEFGSAIRFEVILRNGDAKMLSNTSINRPNKVRSETNKNSADKIWILETRTFFWPSSGLLESSLLILSANLICRLSSSLSHRMSDSPMRSHSVCVEPEWPAQLAVHVQRV